MTYIEFNQNHNEHPYKLLYWGGNFQYSQTETTNYTFVAATILKLAYQHASVHNTLKGLNFWTQIFLFSMIEYH